MYGFKSGGVRQMREELERLHARLVKEAQASSDLTMDALERKYNELKWDVERRLEVAFCQAMSALVTCFQQTLYVHTHDHRDFGPYPLKACGIDYLEMLTRVGFLFSVESLLSTYGNELGMLGDTEAAVKELGRVHIKLRPVKSPRAAAFRVSITSGPSGIVIELPIITRRASEFPDRSMHRVPGQDAVSGAIYLSLSTPEQKMRAKFLFQKPIRVVPVIFSQGLNEMQTVANTVGKASLQKEINMEYVVQLEAYVNKFADWCLKKQRRDKAPLRFTMPRTSTASRPPHGAHGKHPALGPVQADVDSEPVVIHCALRWRRACDNVQIGQGPDFHVNHPRGSQLAGAFAWTGGRRHGGLHQATPHVRRSTRKRSQEHWQGAVLLQRAAELHAAAGLPVPAWYRGGSRAYS